MATKRVTRKADIKPFVAGDQIDWTPEQKKAGQRIYNGLLTVKDAYNDDHITVHEIPNRKFPDDWFILIKESSLFFKINDTVVIMEKHASNQQPPTKSEVNPGDQFVITDIKSGFQTTGPFAQRRSFELTLQNEHQTIQIESGWCQKITQP